MIRKFVMLCLAAATTAFAAPAAKEVESPTLREIRELRAAVDVQSKQIEALTQQVVRMTVLIEMKRGPVVTEPVATPAASAQEAPKAEAVAPKAEFSVNKVEPAPTGQHHVVVKGENLTTIAKLYNISLAELQKANKDVTPAKLQIGHTLNIPAPKTPEQPPEKKENP